MATKKNNARAEMLKRQKEADKKKDRDFKERQAIAQKQIKEAKKKPKKQGIDQLRDTGEILVSLNLFYSSRNRGVGQND